MAPQLSSWKGAGLVLALFSFQVVAMEEGVYRSLARTDRPLPAWVRAPEFAPPPPKPLTVFESAKGYKPPQKASALPKLEIVINETKDPVPDNR